jgi:hypothetical protein
MKCSKCQEECYPFETQCSSCLHKQTMLNIKSMEQHLTKLFAKKGIDYNEFKQTILGETI